ncbi:MAG: cyclic nucleotide-binding domain-containing protein [Proteobacteria bacterium]|nr:cyclic nucleotide-binding domain-containing protein [Pseudomonadota bacterium]
MGRRNLQRTIDKAEKLYSKGKYQSALDSYEQIREFGKDDPKIFLRLGDISRRLGNVNLAIDNYKAAARGYAHRGFIVKAIAVCKVILNLDPSRVDIENNLAALYLKKNNQLQDTLPGEPTQTIAPEAKEEKAPELPLDAIAIEIVEDEYEPADGDSCLIRTPLFSDLGPDELTGIIKKLKASSYAEGDYVFRRGDDDNAIYIITSGEVEILSLTKYSEEIKSAALKEGDFFGEHGYFSGSRRGSDAKALTDIDILEISKEDMDSLAAEYPGIHKVLYDFYKERVIDKSLALSKVFKHLSAEDRKGLLESVQIESFPKGTAVIRENDKGENMYVIVSGIAEVWNMGKDGKRKSLITLQENDYFGEAAVVLGTPRLSNVTAISTCLDLVSIGGKSLEKVLAKYPEVKSVLEGVAKRHVEISQV